MFEIPDDDDNFWNDVPLEDSFLSKSRSLAGKENRPQLRVPDTACTGNPAKRLCTDFNRDGALSIPPDVNKSLPQIRSTSSVNNSNNTIGNTGTVNVSRQQSDSCNAYNEAPFHIPFPAATPCSNTVSSIQAEYQGSKTNGNTDKHKASSAATRTDANIENTSLTCSEGDKNVPKRTGFPANINGIHAGKESSIQPHCIQRESRSTDVDRRRSRSGENEAGDHVTPKRKRKFPGPAGILPKLGPGRSLDMMSPATLNTSTPVSDKSPQDDSVILCSQQTDDIFNEPAWQSLLTDMGEEGQILLKKFSISSTLLKAGKKQLMQGKAALIFGVIDSIESHGSEASVTIRDRSGRMQGTIHRDLLKDHEADLQIGTVLVLKQVSIISLSNRNHYLNITPNNIVMLYRGGESSLRSLKFHGSEDSLQSVLSALEKKAATHRSSMNSSLSMTPSSHTGSSRQSLTGSSTGTPQLFGASPLTGLGTSTPQRYDASPSTPVPNQRLFSPQMPVTGTSPGVRGPAHTGVRNVSVVERNNTQFNSRHNISTSNIKNTSYQQGPRTPIVDTNLRSESTVSDDTFFSTPNTNFKVVSIQNDTNLSHLNTRVNLPLHNQSTGIHMAANTTTAVGVSSSSVNNICVTNILQQTASTNPVLNTPSTGGKSRWKFKSPPSRSGSLPTSPDLSAIPGNTVNNRIGSLNGIKPSAVSNTGTVGNMNRNGSIDVADNKGNGPIGRTCRLNDPDVGQNTGPSCRTNTPHDSETASAWSFNTSRIVPTVGAKQCLPGQPGRSDAHVSDDNLWEDDLSDDLLSQLSEDLS